MCSITIIVRSMYAIAPYCISALDPHACTACPATEQFLTFFAREETFQNYAYSKTVSGGHWSEIEENLTIRACGVHLHRVFHLA